MDETTGEMKMNLRQKLAAIRREIHNVEKTGENTFHNYKYVTASDMAGILGTALAKADIIVSRRNMKVTRILENPYSDRPEKAEVVVSIECEYGFLDCDSAEEIWAPSYGEGRDKGDKGGFKAHTGALKYFLIQAFLLATGDDPENSSKEDEERNRPVNRTESPRQAAAAPKPTVAPRTTGPAPARPDYVSELQFKNLEDTAKRHLGEGNGTFKLAMWCKEFDCTKTTTTRNQWKTMMEWIVDGEPEHLAAQREPGDEPQEDLEAGFRASIDGDAPLSTDLDAALGTVNHTMNRIGEQNHGGNCITEGQQKRLFAIAKGNKTLLKEVRESFGFQHDRDIPKGAPYERVVAALEAAVNGAN